VIDRATFDALQGRWVSGDALSADEDAARVAYAAVDPLAARELALFAELGGRLSAPDDEAPNVASALARLRGVRLRVVAPGEVKGQGRSPFRRGTLVVLAALAAAAAAAVVLVRRQAAQLVAHAPVSPPAAPAPAAALASARSELVFASGDVTLGGGPAKIGGPTLGEGQHVATREGRACLSIDPGIDVCIGPYSEVLLDALGVSDVRVRVASGAAVAALAPRSGGHTFSLLAGDTEATAHGTVFALEAKQGRPERVTVLEGTVAVAATGGQGTLVPAHFGLSLTAGRAPALEQAGRGEEARLLSVLAPKELAHGAAVGVLEIAEEGPLRVSVDEHGPYELPLRAFVSAGRHRVALHPASGADTMVDTSVEPGGVRELALPKAAPPSEEAVPSAHALLEQARARLASGDSRGASALYERLRQTHPGSPEAHTVLVSLGKLELESGSAERALELFDGYAKQGGALLPEALSGRIRALRALGRRADERRAIASYLASYPKSFAAQALQKRLDTLTEP